VAHTIEEAKSSRASCRSCRKTIQKGELRFGEETLNRFSGDGGTTFAWHHLACAAEKKPAELKEALATYSGPLANRAELEATIAKSAGTKKPEFPYAERAPTARSKCLACQEAIDKGQLRVAIEREVDTGTFVAKSAGYLHPGCAQEFIQDEQLLDKVKANSQLSEEDQGELEAEW
jgi:poly [ADP-ribose] polymerase